MGWVKIDDGFVAHRKVRQLTDSAFRLYLSAILWSNRNLTDGVIKEDELRLVSDVARPRRAVVQLERAGLWEVEPGGWRIHDYLDYQYSAVQIRAAQSKKRERQARWRSRIRDASTEPSRDASTEPSRDEGEDASRDATPSRSAPTRAHARTQPNPRKERKDLGGDRPVSERGGEGNAPPNDPPQATTNGRPAPQCPRHRGRTDDPPCRACREAREAADVWDNARRLDELMTVRRCPYCDAEGWRYQRGLRVPLTPYVRCDHAPFQGADTEEARRA